MVDEEFVNYWNQGDRFVHELFGDFFIQWFIKKIDDYLI